MIFYLHQISKFTVYGTLIVKHVSHLNINSFVISYRNKINFFSFIITHEHVVPISHKMHENGIFH